MNDHLLNGPATTTSPWSPISLEGGLAPEKARIVSLHLAGCAAAAAGATNTPRSIHGSPGR